MQDEGYLYSKYSGAFSTPVKIDSCNKLRAEKWKVCHPTGDTNSTLSCSVDMDIDKLQDIYNSHVSCYTYRKLENESKCFSSSDPGHIKAQEVELTLANSCLEILKLKLKHKIEEQVVEPHIIEQEEPGYGIKQKNIKKEPTSLWNNVLRIALIILAVILLFLFVFYVL